MGVRRDFSYQLPPWASSFDSSASSSSAAATSASAPDADGDDNPHTSTTGSSTIDPSVSSATMDHPTTFITSQASVGNPFSSVFASLLSASATASSDGTGSTASVPTQAFESLSESGPSATSPAQTSIPSSSNPTAYPNDAPSSSNDRHSFNATVLAAVVVPIIALLFFGVGALIWLRRRRRARGVPFRPIMEVKEKMFSKRNANANVEVHPVEPPQPHLITSPQNDAYFTGLETMSMMSAEPRRNSTEDPPPPYMARNEVSPRSVLERSPVSPITAPLPALLDLTSPVSPQDSRAVPETSPFDDPPSSVRRAGSNRSITSTLYSSTASLAEARPARRSTLGAYVVNANERSPFADPETESDER